METIRVQVSNKGNSGLIAELSKRATLVKRSGVRVGVQMQSHVGCKGQYNSNQGHATFDITPNLLAIIPNDCRVLVGKHHVSAKKYKSQAGIK